ncbi:MAG: hypothetical protein A4S09_13825 [Proteobacteria bacterium SG_bin7]|nr:MAG: hypothetical protein A4S09_13825 [Proteobacteria bacterium SG_bin7]
MFDRKEIRLLTLLTLVHFGLIVDFMIVMPLGPQLMRIFGIEPHQFSWLVSGYTLSAGTMGIIASLFLDFVNKRRALIFFLLGFAVSNFVCGIIRNFEMLVFARCLMGLFGGVVGSLIFSITSDRFEVERRSSAFGIVMTAHALAAILGLPICLFLATKFSWQTPFLLLATFSLIMVLVITRFLPEVFETVSQSKVKLPSLTRNQIFALLFMSLLVLGHFSINPFLFPSVIANAKVDESQLPTIYLVCGVVSIVASILFGWLSDRYGKKKIFTLALLLSIIPIYFVTNMKVLPFTLILTFVSLFFIVMTARMIPAMSLVTTLVSLEGRTSFLSLIASVQQLSAALAAYLSGLLVTKSASGHLLGFEKVGYIAVLFSATAFVVSFKLKPIEGNDL